VIASMSNVGVKTWDVQYGVLLYQHRIIAWIQGTFFIVHPTNTFDHQIIKFPTNWGGQDVYKVAQFPPLHRRLSHLLSTYPPHTLHKSSSSWACSVQTTMPLRHTIAYACTSHVWCVVLIATGSSMAPLPSTRAASLTSSLVVLRLMRFGSAVPSVSCNIQICALGCEGI
jgi:hypothetical protein